MPYDPIAKKAYDKERNARMKQEYLNANPSYTPTRQIDKKRVEDRKNSYLANGGGFTQKNIPSTQSNYSSSWPTFESTYKAPNISIDKPRTRPNNNVEADRPQQDEDDYSDFSHAEKVQMRMIKMNNNSQYYNQVYNQLRHKKMNENINYNFV